MKIERMRNLWLSGLIVTLLCLWSLPVFAGTAKLPPTGPWDAAAGKMAVPDYFSTANWAYSPPLTKFVDRLPGLGAANANANGQYLPVGTPDITTYPGSDYYEIELVEYSETMHSDMPPTRLRGYRQTNKGTDTSNCGAAPKQACSSANLTVEPPPIPHYLGPVLVSTKDRPVRIKFTNNLPTGQAGDLFIPVDTTFMGAGPGPVLGNGVRGQGTPCASDAIPLPGNPNPNNCTEYTQNRATLHLHGGRTPWISDGTPHQWITPAAENTPYPKGVSVRDVPDMPQSDPLDGSQTFFYSNQQSARLMFYHDHAFGITRLNVYAGEAAGYLITDKWEQDLVARGILPADQIPLVIQDRTFVDATPTAFSVYDPNTLVTTPMTLPAVRVTDPLWNWGTGAADVNGVRTPITGDLWMPHVYMTNQNPYNPDLSGTNAFGRWFYGPWFYPPTVINVGPQINPYFDADCADPTNVVVYANCKTPGQPPVIPGTEHPSSGMEAFMDTAVVNGTAFPVLEVDPKAYRFRILNAANDRGMNLSIYKADMTLAAPAGPVKARLDDHTEIKMVPAATPAPGVVWPPLWPVDGRLGGVPDPGVCTQNGAGEWNCSNWGPKFIQIGTEGGFLPAPVVRDPQPVTWVTNPAAFWVGVVQDTGLALMPAERADVVVDFSAYAGQTLILYNDGPTAWPALDPRYDFFTGYPDMRDTGGYGVGGTYDAVTKSWTGGQGVLAGFGPNTRTVMQIKVRAGAPVAFNKAALDAEFTNLAPATALNPVLAAPASQVGKTLPLFQRAQEPIIVAQAAYQNAYPDVLIPTAFPWWGKRSSMLQHSLDFITVEGKKVSKIMEPKAIHDEMGASFDKIYGRMQSNLGMEIPNPTTNNANMIIYGYQDVPSETIINSAFGPVQVSVAPIGTLLDGTQIWNISHNGVDTHPIHFHIFDVQVINRIGWDGMLANPDPNEIGWKDTVRISPLMDTIVAVRPVAPLLPFGIPDSNRALNPALPIGSLMGFSQVDWLTNGAFVPPVTNQLTSFGWEYVWHCHILSHEEMDMMRPIVLLVDRQNMTPPVLTSVTPAATLTWTDATPAATATAVINQPVNEIGFRIQRCSTLCNDPNSYVTIATTLANSTSYTDTSALASSVYSYRVVAYNAFGPSASNVMGITTGSLVKPTVSIATNPVATTYAFGAPIVIDATTAATAPATVSKVDYFINGGFYASNAVAPFGITINNASSGILNVTAVVTDSDGMKSLTSNTLALTVYGVTAAPAAITVPAGSSTGDYTVSWTASTNVGATYVLEESTDNFATAGTPVVLTNPALTSQAFVGKAAGFTYYYRVKAQNPPNADSTFTTGANGCIVTLLAPPAWILAPTASSNGIYSVTWGASTTPDASYILEESTNGFTSVTGTYLVVSPGIVPPLPTSFSYSFTGKANGTYSYRVRANLVGAAAPSIPTVVKNTVVTLAAATYTLPDFSQPLLTGASQTPWENVIPNALADYFTYVPYTTADAVKLGFPSSCGRLPGDAASTEDCYTITARNITQQMALPSIFGGGSGLLGPTGTALGAATSAYGYGSGGPGWVLPYYDTTKAGVVAGTAVTGNAPAGPLAAGVWHFPAPTIKGTSNRPVRVQWLNELANTVPTGLDPSVDCGPNAPNCFPYNRIVTHVHGAHVPPESDGLASAWFTPGFAITGEDFVSTRQHGPEGTYRYPMTNDQASTIWYHDHAMGTTHNNTNMGLAGFFPITDANEQAQIAAGKLPVGPYELGFALQDRHFTTAGQFAMPDYPIYDRTTPGCVINAITGLPEPASCTMLKWMKAADGHFVPYVAGDPLLLNLNNIGEPGIVKAPFSAPGAGAPYGAPSATLEYFGNMPVVNGVVYGKNNIEPRVYRMRFIGGSDSRTWVMQLVRTDTGATLPIHVIASEQGLLNAPVPRNEVDLMPGERIDVLVDFTGIPYGTRVVMNNLGSDTPWAGYDDFKAQVLAATWVRSADIPEIMTFDVTVPLSATPITTAPTAIATLRAAPIVPLTTPANVRNVSLMEITDVYGRTMPTIDSRGFKPVGIPVTEIIKLNDVEQWDIINTTVDAHPMHLHQVAFQVINRQALAVDAFGTVLPSSFTPPVDDVLNQQFTPPTYAPAVGAALLPPELWEMGWKDTITTPPGYVTRVIAKFDITGDYVWHCHILSHEEHDMMRPFTVTDAAFAAPAPASITVPAGSVSGSYTASWVGTAITGVQYELQEALNAGAFTTIYTGAAPRFDVLNRAAGSYTYQVRALATAGFTNSLYRVGANAAVVARTIITFPAAGNIAAGTTIDATAPAAPAGKTTTRVDFFDNGVLVASDTTAAPATTNYSVAWTPPAGTHNLTAATFFSDGASSVSPAVVVTVTAGAVPTLTINALPASIDLGTPTTVTATPAGAAGFTLTGLYFSENGAFLSWANPGTTSITWTPSVAGARTLTATAYYIGLAAPVTTAVGTSVSIVPAAPVATAATLITGTGFTANWGSVTLATSYSLDVSTDINFATFIAGYNNLNVGNVTSVAVTGLLPITTYHYRVRANNSNIAGVSSNVVSVLSALASPAWFSVPANTDANGTVYMIAAASPTPGATYNYEYSNNGGTSWTPATIGTNLTAVNPTITLPAPGTYLFRVYVTASGYAASGYTVGTGPCIYSAVAVAPAWFSVPANAATNGTVYMIAAASPTPGATYNYEYSNNGGTSWTPATIGTNLTAVNPTITLPAPGTYLFRVYATANGFTASSYTTGSGACVYLAISNAPTWFSVPATSNANGTVYMIAAASPTPGATYNYEYSNNGGTSWTPATIGTNLTAVNPTITLPAPGTYLFRVYVTASGYAASGYTAGSSPCLYSTVVAAPPWFSVPATTTTGNVYVIAGASATPGVVYKFEYSTNGAAGPWTAIGVVGALNQTLTLPAATGTTTYTFRVTAIDPTLPIPVYSPSAPTLGNNTILW